MKLKLDKEWFEANITLENDECTAGSSEETLKAELIKVIAKLAVQYDAKYGRFPENRYEGFSFYEFVCSVLGYKPDDLKNEHKEVYK